MPFERKTARELYADAEKKAKQRVSEGKTLLLSPKAETDGDEATLYVYDAIGAWFGIAAADFVQALADIKAGTIHLRIDSPGGSVFEAEAMQTALQQHPARVIAHIDGLAASAATTLALGAEEIEISDGGVFMIHNAWNLAIGNKDDMREAAAFLEKIDANIAADYQRKTGASPEQIKEWMDAEAWFSSAEALEHGFVDRIYTPAGDGEGSDEDSQAKAKAAKAQADADTQALTAARAARLRALRLIEIGN
jgi:ATP-dependent protease ClpP protease subunit